MILVEFFLKRPKIANLLVILIVLVGSLTLTRLNRAGYPEVDFNILRVTTIYPGASAEDIEINVTKKIEDELEDVDGLEKVLSSSLEDISLVYAFVDADASDPDWVKDEISRAVDRVSDLPAEIDGKPSIKELRSSNVAVLELAIQGDVPEKQLRKVAEDLEDEIKEINGVGSVEKVGYRKREVKIEVSSEALEEMDVSLGGVIQAIQNQNVRVSGGNLESFTDEKQIVTYSEFDSPLEVGEVILRSNFSGHSVRVDEVAVIRDDFEQEDVKSRTRGQNSINLLIRSQGNADIITISERVNETIEKFRKHLPKDVNIHLVSDFSYYTASMLKIVQNNGLLGFVLVILCLSIFLTKTTAFWTAAGIPISVLGAFSLFPFFGVEINFISLITLIIVLGLIVDDAIVVAENITRLREKGMSARDAAIEGVKGIRWPVLTTVVTTILAFLSIGFMSGITGKFVREIPIVVTLTLAVSLFESLFILPIHIAHGQKSEPRRHQWFEKVKEFYKRMLKLTLRFRFRTIIVFFLFLVGSSSLFLVGMKLVLFPYQDADIFHVIIELPEGYSLEKTSKKVSELEGLVEEIEASQLVNYTTRVGHHDTSVYGGTAGFHSNWALITVYLKPASERHLHSEMIMDQIREKSKRFEDYTRLEVAELYDGPPIGKPITVTIIGDDDAVRSTFFQEVSAFLHQMEGVKNIDAEEGKDKREIRLRPNYEAMARLGVSARDLGNTIRAAYEGVVATEITRGGEEIDFRVQLKPEERRNLEILKNIQVPNNQGKLVFLKHLVQMESTKGYEVVRHYNGNRSITLAADVDTQVTTSSEANGKIRDKFFTKIQSTPGFRMVFGGEEKATQESMRDFYIAFVCTLIAMYFVLVILFNSFFQPLIILAALPFAMGGVFVVFYLHGLPISFLAMIGILGLVGVVVNDSLIMVSHLNEISEAAKLTLEEIVDGAKERLRPVLLTTFTTIAAMIPTIYGLGGEEPFIVPVVLALAGGLVFGTTITLILVPLLYSIHSGRSSLSDS